MCWKPAGSSWKERRRSCSTTPRSATPTLGSPDMTAPRCILICVGSELLRGKINTHASAISRRLSAIGLELNAEVTVGDEEAEIAEAIRRALVAFQVVIVTGGLGPTFDDLTREAASAASGLRLHRSP